jgi:hypothetical protein
VAEAEIADAIAAHEAARSRTAPLAIGTAAPAEAVAQACEAAVAAWLAAMRRTARSGRAVRDLGLEPALMEHLIDELQQGVHRAGLAEEIATAYTAGRLRGAPVSGGATGAVAATADGVGLAAYSCRIIVAFLELAGGGRGRETAEERSRPDEGAAVDPANSGTASPGYGPRAGLRRRLYTTEAGWEQAFTALVEENIAAAHLQAARGDRDRELWELLQLFAAGPFEVDA